MKKTPIRIVKICKPDSEKAMKKLAKKVGGEFLYMNGVEIFNDEKIQTK